MPNSAPHRSAHLMPTALVFLGGMLGVLTRYGLTLAGPDQSSAWVTGGINILGALLLGVLVGLLSSRAPQSAKELRQVFGTGFLGGFTTYSALAVHTVELAKQSVWLAGVYAGGNVTLGVLMAWAGLTVGHRIGDPS